MNKLNFHITCLLVCTCFFLWGQNGQFIYESKDADLPFTITQFSSKHGLPQNQVLSIFQYHDGRLILSTANGMAQFDGEKFSEFISDQDHKNVMFTDFIYDKKHRRLYGLQFGGNFHVITPEFRLLGNPVKTILHRDTLFGIMRPGELVFSSLKQVRFKKILSTGIQDPQALHYAYPHFYVGTKKGLFRINRNNGKLKQLSDLNIKAIKRIPGKGTYVLVINGLYKLHDSGRLEEIYFSPSNRINCYDFIPVKDEFYIVSSIGLIRADGKTSTLYNKQNKFPSEDFQSIYYSESNNCLFIGTSQKGLLRLDFKHCTTISQPNEFNLSSLSSIVPYLGEVLVCGTSGTIYRINPRSSQADTYFKHPCVFASLAVIGDTLVAGTWGEGIYLIRDQKIIGRIDSKNTLPDRNVISTFRDSKGVIWVGTSAGFSRGSSLSELRSQSLLKDQSVICFSELRNGNICLGTKTGFFIFSAQGKLLREISFKDGFYGKEVRAFYEDRQGKLWVGSYNGGLYCYENGKLTPINRMANCKLPVDAFCIARDRHGMLYFTGNLGLYAVHEKDLDDFYRQKTSYLIPYYLGEESGIYNTEFNGGFQHNFLYFGGRFYFPTIEGIAILKPIKFRQTKLNPFFSKLMVNDTLAPLNETVFGPSTYSISIEFTCPNLNINNNVYYQYKLIGPGTENSWNPLQKTSVISFKLLPPGKYKLIVRAIDAFNQEHPKEIQYAFQVKPHFYQTLLFYVLVACVLVLVSGYIVKKRMDGHQRKLNENNKINNQILELKLAAIQARMNPHFIFNTLNSIKYFLAIENKQKAEDLVDDFSLLMRRFLHYTDTPFITIGQETELLKLYLDIEKTRFNNSFTYTIQTDDDIENEYIPTMLIQPFVENAIQHGIAHISHPGKLDIRIEKKGDFTIFTIEDNGIGYQQSTEINKNRKNHISSGIKLVEDKIVNLKEKYDIFVSLNIHKNQENGTKVVLKILNDNDELRYH